MLLTKAERRSTRVEKTSEGSVGVWDRRGMGGEFSSPIRRRGEEVGVRAVEEEEEESVAEVVEVETS